MTRIVLLLLLLPATGFTQNFIGKNKAQVKKELQRQLVKSDSLIISLTDNDSILVFSSKENKGLPTEFVYRFDSKGKCKSEKMTVGCDSCFKKSLKAVLENKKFGWKKINEHQYVSKYEARMMIDLPADNYNFYFTVLQTEWTPEMYILLTGN